MIIPVLDTYSCGLITGFQFSNGTAAALQAALFLALINAIAFFKGLLDFDRLDGIALNLKWVP